MSIVDTSEKDVSNVDRKLDKIKVRTYSIKSSSTLFPCSIYVIYNRVHSTQNKHLTLKSYIPGINTSILPKKYYENIFSERLVNTLHAWIENHPHAIHPTNLKDSLFFKINVTLVNKQKHLLQISARELHNDMRLKISEGVNFGAKTVDGKICIGYMSLKKYMPKTIKNIATEIILHVDAKPV